MREHVIKITLQEANRYFALSKIGLDGHYLGPSHNRNCLSNPERDAITLHRAPIAASFNKALSPPLELSRMWCAESRTKEATSFVGASIRWLRKNRPEADVVTTYADTAEGHPRIRFIEIGVPPAGTALVRRRADRRRVILDLEECARDVAAGLVETAEH